MGLSCIQVPAEYLKNSQPQIRHPTKIQTVFSVVEISDFLKMIDNEGKEGT